MREHDRQRHQFVGLRAGEPEHETLVAGAARVHALRDVAGLLVNRGQDAARFGIESELGARVPDVSDRGPNHILVFDHRRGGDFAGDDREPGRHQRLAGDASGRVLGEDGVQNRIRNLVGDLVGMSFGHRLRGKEVPSVTAHAATLLLRASELDAAYSIDNVYDKQLSLADSCTWVESFVHGPQPRLEHVRVDLRGRQVGMAKHHLDGTQVGSAFEQVRRERVAQHVRADRGADAGPAAVCRRSPSRTRRD